MPVFLLHYAFTNTVTDAYAVAGDELTVRRQLSVVVQPLDAPNETGPGHIAILADGNADKGRQTIVYRRQAVAR